MGFEPIVTGATIQRVSRFATATPIGTLVVPHNRFELLFPGCKPGVLPLDEWDLVGGARQDQTANLLFAKQALSRLSYGPLYSWCPIADSNRCCLVENQVSYPLDEWDLCLARRPGVEPGTVGFGGRCSVN